LKVESSVKTKRKMRVDVSDTARQNYWDASVSHRAEMAADTGFLNFGMHP